MPEDKLLPARFRIRASLDQQLGHLAVGLRKSKQELVDEAIKDLLEKYAQVPPRK